jgi:hypothetical protein
LHLLGIRAILSVRRREIGMGSSSLIPPFTGCSSLCTLRNPAMAGMLCRSVATPRSHSTALHARTVVPSFSIHKLFILHQQEAVC